MQTQSNFTQLQVQEANVNMAVLAYQTYPNRTPASEADYVAVWQGGPQLPATTPPLHVQQIPSDASGGSLVFTGLDLMVNNYLFGYGNGGTLSAQGQQPYGNVGATVYCPDQNGQRTNFASQLYINTVQADSVGFNFSLPQGITPQANGAWVGIWEGNFFDSASQPMQRSNIDVNVSEGTGVIDGVEITINTTYTVGLFLDNSPGSMAGYVVFAS